MTLIQKGSVKSEKITCALVKSATAAESPPMEAVMT